MREAQRAWIVFLIFLSGSAFAAQKEMKRWPASQRFMRQESLAWMDLCGRFLSALPAAAV
jgi:hypothetical protein